MNPIDYVRSQLKGVTAVRDSFPPDSELYKAWNSHAAFYAATLDALSKLSA